VDCVVEGAVDAAATLMLDEQGKFRQALVSAIETEKFT
jgi:hypothetical protein